MANSVLLPSSVKPVLYTLRLEPMFETFKFKGSVAIDVEVISPVQEIKMHALHLDIHSAEISFGEKTLRAGREGVPEVSLDADRAELTISTGAGSVLPAGKAVIKFEYTGTLNDNMVGFYRSSYQTGGEKHWMATTQFEAVGARQALPCWDEPAVKAVFDVTLVVPKGLTGLSNMPVVSSESREDGASILRFDKTPIMSTYLLAFVVGELESVSGKTKDGKTEINVYTTAGKKQQGEFALRVASEIIPFFVDYFGIQYPLPKADLVGIPDFAAGAMENWGLITFRENALLVDEGNASAATKQRVAYVVSHELAHQWFGNLVTMKWWNDLWLNEGFATWVGWLGVDHLFPEWDVWTQFVCNDMSRALITDALLGSHPVEVPINDPKEIEQVFDALSYMKGASVIRQLEAAVGSAEFKMGMHSYLTRHVYSNTVTNDLWLALEEASGKPVKQMMESWTLQMGYPVLSLLPASTTSSSTPSYSVRQTRFLSKGPPSPAEDSLLWWVPVTAIVGSSAGDVKTIDTFVLSEKEAEAPQLQVPDGGWLRLNSGQSGIFRVNYPEPLWKALGVAVSKMQLPTLDRLGTVMDAFALAQAGLLRTSAALELATAFDKETEYTVWSQLADDLGEVELLAAAGGFLDKLEAVLLRLFLPIAEKLGWEPAEGESHVTAMLRPLVLGRLGRYKHQPTIEKCREKFSAMTQDLQAVKPDLRGFVMSTAVKNGGKAELEAAKKLYAEAATPDFKILCLSAMGATQDQGLFKEFLDFSLDESNVKAQDQLYVFRIMSSNSPNRAFAWSYFKEHWETIHSRFVSATAIFRYVPALPLKGFASDEVADDAEKFYEAHPVPGGIMELQRTIETIRARAAWLKRDGNDMAKWLETKA